MKLEYSKAFGASFFKSSACVSLYVFLVYVPRHMPPLFRHLSFDLFACSRERVTRREPPSYIFCVVEVRTGLLLCWIFLNCNIVSVSCCCFFLFESFCEALVYALALRLYVHTYTSQWHRKMLGLFFNFNLALIFFISICVWKFALFSRNTFLTMNND